MSQIPVSFPTCTLQIIIPNLTTGNKTEQAEIQQPILDPPEKWGHKTSCLPETGETGEFREYVRISFLESETSGASEQ